METVGKTVLCDDLFQCLSHIQRRRLLVELLNGSTVIISEGNIPMQHVHLPKLEEYGFIDWDRDTHGITKGPRFDEIRPLLELLDNHENKLPSDWV